jgi:hypothetical protein
MDRIWDGWGAVARAAFCGLALSSGASCGLPSCA